MFENIRKLSKTKNFKMGIVSWKELISDILLIDKEQTYGLHKHANMIATIICRSILIIIGIYFNYFISCSMGAQYYSLLIFTVIILLETLYICIRRRGIDFKWKEILYYNYSNLK